MVNHPTPPLFWIRYIDDVFGVWTRGEEELLRFCTFVNNLHSSIKVTLSSSPISIRFLDLELYSHEGRILHRIGFKPTDSFSLLPPDSFHPPHVFSGILFSQVYRWCSRSSTYHDFLKTKSIVQRHWRRQGYTRSHIRTTVKEVLKFTCQSPCSWSAGFFPCQVPSCHVCHFAVPTHSVRFNSVPFPLVHRLNCTTPGVIYLITCTRCDLRYVGETSRTLRHRISEHLSNIRSRVSTSVADHFSSTCQPCDFSFTALEHSSNQLKRRKKEQIWIRRLGTQAPSGLNVISNAPDALRLVLPYSECSGRVVRLCQKLIPNQKTCGAYRSHRCLRGHLTAHR